MADIESKDMQNQHSVVSPPFVNNALDMQGSHEYTPSFIAENLADELIRSGMYEITHNIPFLVEKYVSSLGIEFDMQNSMRSKENKFRIPKEVPNHIIARFIAARNDVALIGAGRDSVDLLDDEEDEEPLDRDKLPIGIYQYEGANEGTYQICDNEKGIFGDLVAKYKPCATNRDKKEVYTAVRGLLPIRHKCNDPYLTITGNCIFDMETKSEISYSPDFVFTSKIRTKLNRDALNNPPNVYFVEDGTYLTVDEFINDLANGDDELVQLFWEILQAVCLPLAPRNKAILLFSKYGNNGKGTLCELLRNLIGKTNTASIPLHAMGEEFGLENLGNAFAIIVDENRTNLFSDKNDILKALITGDVVSINRKHVSKYDMAWKGLMVQCLNALPKIADKTDSMKRRLLIVPMPSRFQGRERKYIKNKFIRMREVREYILAKVLIDMDYRDSFFEPQCTKDAMQEFERQNEAVSMFCEEILPQCTWDLLPATDFLYEVFREWYKKTAPSGKVIGRNEFIESLKDYVNANNDPNFEWEWTDSTRSQNYISDYEPLLVDYNIHLFSDTMLGWPSSRRLKSKYSGLKRRSFALQADDD